MSNWEENVRTFQPGAAEVVALQRQERTPAQQHMDHAFDLATEGASQALAEVQGSLAWMETMGEVPAQFRNMPVLLGQWKAWIVEQKRIKQ